MGIWIEMRCDVRKPGCYSDVNKGPMRLIPTFKTVTHVQSVINQAIFEGWAVCSEGIACPSCKEKL